MPRCRICHNAHRRARPARAAVRALPIPPDDQPARALRQALGMRRQAGLPWDDETFEVLIAQVCRSTRESRWEADSWPAILREQQTVWRAAYTRSGRVLALSADLAR